MRRFIVFLLTVCLCLAVCARAEESDTFDWTLRVSAAGGVSAADMFVLPEGGVYLAGSVEGEADCGDPLGGKDAYVARVEMDGSIRWQKRLGGSDNDRFTHVIEGVGGGCLALGITSSADGDSRAARGGEDAFLARLNEDGEVVWTKCLGGTADDELLAVSRWDDGGYLVCGRTKSYNGDFTSNHGGWDAWAMLLSEADGKPQWVVRFGEGGDDSFSLILPEYDRWTLVGEQGVDATEIEEGYEPQPVLVTIDSTGTVLSEQTLGGDGESRIISALETDGGWLLGGQTSATSALMPTGRGGLDLWVMQLRSSGTLSWQRTYGGSGDERFYSLLPVAGNGYLYLATTESDDGQITGGHGARDVWVVKVSAQGALEWQQTLGGSEASSCAGAIADGEGGYYVAGSSTAQDGDIGWHTSMTTGFLAHLAENGNLLSMELLGGAEEFRVVQFERGEEGAYLLGAVRRAETTGIAEEIWLARLAE